MAVPAQQPVILQQPILFNKIELQEAQKLQATEKQEAMAAILASDIEFEIEDPAIEKKKEKEATVPPKAEKETESVEIVPIFHEEEIVSPKPESKSVKEAAVAPTTVPPKRERELRTFDVTKLKTREFKLLGEGGYGSVYYIEYLDPIKNQWIPCAYKRFHQRPRGSHYDDVMNEVRRWVQIGTERVEGLCQLIAIVHSDPQSPINYPNKIFDTVQKQEIIPKGISLMFEHYNANTLLKHLGYILKDADGKPYNIIKPSYPQAVKWFRTLFASLAHLHSKKIIHGDICARNIMFHVIKSDRPGVDDIVTIKLIDLGLGYSWEEDNENRKSHIINVQPTYQALYAPELHYPPRGDNFPAYSTKTDIFSLGFVLAELLLGELCEGKSALGRYMITYQWFIEEGLIPKLWNIYEKYPRLVNTLVKCLDANPENRPEAAQVVSFLENLDPEKEITLLFQRKMEQERLQKQKKEEEERRRKNECCVIL